MGIGRLHVAVLRKPSLFRTRAILNRASNFGGAFEFRIPNSFPAARTTSVRRHAKAVGKIANWHTKQAPTDRVADDADYAPPRPLSFPVDTAAPADTAAQQQCDMATHVGGQEKPCQVG